MAVGDISLQTRNNKHPFENIKQTFKNKDILFGNLETTLSLHEEKQKKAVILHSSPKKTKYLKEARFDILNIANNHIMDLGVEGLLNTINVLNKNDLIHIGVNACKSASKHIILEKNGVKLGFLGYTIGRFKIPKEITINKIVEKEIISDLDHIKDKCDFIVVSLHWGTENVFYPSPKQIEIAHNLIDHGATLILGHHPHVIQGIEEYKDGLIAYSLGNFQFNTNVSQSKTNNSIVLCVDFNGGGIKNYEIVSIIINDDFLPTVIEGQEKDEALNFITEISRKIGVEEITMNWWFEEIGETYLSCNLKSYVNRIKRYGLFHLLECIAWLATPFCIRCYAGVTRRRFKALLKTGAQI